MILTLVIANKNYSSWSFRPWILMRHFGLALEEAMIPLAQENTRAEMLRFSPSGRLRQLLPMNMRRAVARRELTPEASTDVARLEQAFAQARGEFGQAGAFLFGDFSAADAMFAPVVNRLHVYDVAVTAATHAYMDAMMALPAWQEWRAQAEAETWIIGKYEAA